MTDNMGRKIIHHIHFRNVQSDFGFLKLMCVEKDGYEVNNSVLGIQKDGYIHKWSDVQTILRKLVEYKMSSGAHLKKAQQELDLCDEFIDSPSFQFI